MVQSLETLRCQILIDDSDITGTPELLHTPRLFSQEFVRVKSNTNINLLSIPKGYPLVQVFLKHMVKFFSVVFRDYSLMWHSLAIPLHCQNPTWCSRFIDFHQDIFLRFDLSRCNMEMLESEMPSAGNVIFTTVPLSTNCIMDTYHGTLVYYNLSVGESLRPVIYPEGALHVPVKGFLKRSMERNF